MKCDCCGAKYDNMYRTNDTRVYCLPCSRRDSLCCYGKPVIPSTRFKSPLSEDELRSFMARGYKREWKPSCTEITKPRKSKK